MHGVPDQVLEGLIAEDDGVPDVWYLLGLALHAGGEFDEALVTVEEAERLVATRPAAADEADPSAAGELLLDLAELKVGSACHPGQPLRMIRQSPPCMDVHAVVFSRRHCCSSQKSCISQHIARVEGQQAGAVGL